MAHGWPGNVRELRQVAERWNLARRSVPDATLIEVIGTPGGLRGTPRTLREATAAFESELIAQATVANGGHMDDVADYLGIPRRTLNDKMLRLRISKDDLIEQFRTGTSGFPSPVL